MNTVVKKVVESIRDRGVRVTIEVILSELEGWWFDFKWGTDTARHVQLKDLDINSVNKAQGVHYEPTRPSQFRHILDAVAFPLASVFVDFGSGKGRILLLAAQSGFRKVVGVEFSPQAVPDRSGQFVALHAEKRR